MVANLYEGGRPTVGAGYLALRNDATAVDIGSKSWP